MKRFTNKVTIELMQSKTLSTLNCHCPRHEMKSRNIAYVNPIACEMRQHKLKA